MKFVTRSTYDERFRQPAPSGTETEIEYILGTDKKGNPALQEKGVRPTYKIIQESSRGVSVRSIMDRFMAGDTSVVADVSSCDFVDVTSLPTSFLEAQNRLAKASQLFDGLPVHVRNAYGNNVTQFLAACSDGSFYKKYGFETGILKTASPKVNHGENITKELKSIADKIVKAGDSNA